MSVKGAEGDKEGSGRGYLRCWWKKKKEKERVKWKRADSHDLVAL